MRGVFQATIVDSAGSVVPNCNIEARSESSGALVQVYDAIEEGNALGNPFTADEDGFKRFYLESGLYRIRAYFGGFERTWRHVLIGVGPLEEQVTTTVDDAIAALTTSVNDSISSLTTSVDNLIDEIETAIATLGISSGSFTATLSGMTATTQGTIQYRRVGSIVMLFAPSAIVGTSNAATMNLTGLPTACQVVTTAKTVLCNVQDNGNVDTLARASVGGAATISFNLMVVAGSQVRSNAANFTTSGAKGIPSGWSITYDVS